MSSSYKCTERTEYDGVCVFLLACRPILYAYVSARVLGLHRTSMPSWSESRVVDQNNNVEEENMLSNVRNDTIVS